MEKEKGTGTIGAVSINGELENQEEEEINAGKGEELEKEDDEEEKIDKFYDLIRNFRKACSRRRNELIIGNNHDQLEMRKKNKRKYCSESSSWTPKFELEDFGQEDYLINNPLQIFPPNCKKQEEDRDENGLDLKLTL